MKKQEPVYALVAIGVETAIARDLHGRVVGISVSFRLRSGKPTKDYLVPPHGVRPLLEQLRSQIEDMEGELRAN